MTSGIPWLAAAYVLVAASNLLLTLVVGNSLGTRPLGELTMAVTVARMFHAVVDMGLASHLARAVAREKMRGPSLASLFTTARGLLVGLGVVVALVTAFAIRSSEAPSFGLIAIAIGCLNLQLIFEALLLAHQERRLAAVLTGVTAASVIVGCVVWHFVGTSLVQLAGIYVAMTMSSSIVWQYALHSRLSFRPHWRWDTSALASEVKHSWPLGMSVLVSYAALRCSVFLLGLFTDAHQIGAYAAAEMFVTSAGILQAAVSNAVYPELAASFRSDAAKYRRVFWASLGMNVAIGLAVATVLSLAGPQILRLFFAHKDFELSGSIVRIMGWSTPALLVAHHAILVFAATDRHRGSLRMMVAWFFCIAVVQTPLIASFGIHGAAWGLLIGRSLGVAVIIASMFKLGIHRGAKADAVG